MERRSNPFDSTQEDVREDHTAPEAPAPEGRTPKRTVRMRVFNFKPLARPHTEEVTSAPRSASLSRASRLVNAAASLFTTSSPRRS
jgi:hypothetical protein